MLSNLANFEETSTPRANVTSLQQRSEEIASQVRIKSFSLSASVPVPDTPKTIVHQKRSFEVASQQRNENLDSCFSFNGAQIHGGVTINVNNPGPAYKKRKSNRLIFSDSDESQ